jgi:hypothetical protein
MCVILTMLLLPALTVWAQESAASIREVTGSVEIKRPGGDWVPAEAGQELDNEVMISTGFTGTAVVALGNSVLTVRPLTRLTLREIHEAEGSERVNLDLQTGRVRADVNPPDGGRTDFSVHAPTTTASVRGTSFEFDGTQLSVDTGRVHLSGGDGTAVYVGAGHQVTTDTVTGKTPVVAESVQAELVPEKPAGIATSEAPRVDPPTMAEFTLGVTW